MIICNFLLLTSEKSHNPDIPTVVFFETCKVVNIIESPAFVILTDFNETSLLKGGLHCLKAPVWRVGIVIFFLTFFFFFQNFTKRNLNLI